MCCLLQFILSDEAAAASHGGDKTSLSEPASLPEGQIKSEAAGLKACQAPEGTKGGSSRLSSKIKSAFLFQNYFIMAVKALKVATKGRKEKKKTGSDQ